MLIKYKNFKFRLSAFRDWKIFLTLAVVLLSALTYSENDKVAESTNQTSLYMSIGNLVLESEDYIAKPVIANQNEEKKEKTDKEKIQEFLNPLNDARRKEIVYNLFTANGNYKQTAKVLENYALHELNIICGSELSKKINLFRNIDRTTTTFGSILLSRIIAEPQTDKDLLLKRQKAIKYLINNENKLIKIENLLQQIKKSESELLSFWNKSSELDGVLSQLLYAPKEFFWYKTYNKSANWIQFSRIAQLILIGSTYASAPFLLAGLPVVYGKMTYEASGWNRSWKSAIPGICIGLVGSAFYAFTLKLGFSALILQNQLFYAVYQRMQGVYRLIKAIDKLYLLLSKEKELTSCLKLNDQLYNFSAVPDKLSYQLEKLKELLETNSWTKKPNWRSRWGNVLASYTHMQEIKETFIGAMEAIGEIDAYVSVAKLLKEYENKRVNYCFVEYINKPEPFISVKEIWNPLIDASSVTTEDITIGKPDFAHNIMLTGPHGGGKSTFMKSLAYSLILGQTFGIAPAKKATITIFDKINSYVNIKEDLAQGQSTFMAEKKRVDEILKSLKDLKEDEKAFNIMDEVFKGTMEDEGSIRVYKFGKEIASIKNSMCIIATHFKKPADLEIDTQDEWTNYHVGLEEQGDHTFIRTFKIILGKNEWWFNDKEKRERYIDWLTSIN